MQQQTRPPVAGPDGAPPPPVQVLRMGLSHQVSSMISVFARLDLADHLADGPKTSAQLAEATGAHPTSLLRFLRACVAHGLLEQPERGTFALTPVGASMRSDAKSMRGFALGMGQTAHLRPFEHLYDGVMENRSVAKDALGMEMWEYYDTHPEAMGTLTQHLDEVTAQMAPLVAANYDLSRYRRIIDVGGNQGAFLAAMLDSAPDATAVLFDRPEVMDDARKLIAARGLADRVEFVGGDFLQEVPSGGDLYLIKGVLHDWDDEPAARILANCHRAANPDSTLLSFEGIVRSDPPLDQLVHLVDLAMLLLVGGRERTREEFDELFGRAGWRITQAIPLPQLPYFPYHIIEAARQ
jgi:SAM-dependent methyltransferase